MEWHLTLNEPGRACLLQGNEAIARGALEAGIRFAASYPGSPTAEILGMLGRVAKDMDFYAEWSVNETSAFEACMGASFAGVRALCVMKQNGVLTIGDALHTAGLSGCRGGVVLLVGDDPESHSSTNEFDSRHQARAAGIPLLEPATFQEAKDMTVYGFELSEKLQQVVMIRTTTRINHGRGNVILGNLPEQKQAPVKIGEWDRLAAINIFHPMQLSKLDQAGSLFNESPFNWYDGPENPELLIVTCGTGWYYSKEAVETLGLKERVGILKIGTTWPLPAEFMVPYLAKASRILVVEEVDPFLEQNLTSLMGYHPEITAEVFGRAGAFAYMPRVGELNPDKVRDAVAGLMDIKYEGRTPGDVPAEARVNLPPRELTFCAGCPHRATFFSLKQALALDGREGVIMQDIGCYTMAGTRAGHYMVRGLGCMGGGINMAEGLSQLTRFGMNQPVIALAGDSTFFHSCLPGLVNAKYQNANMLFLILDNSATAMTGFQPHPGINVNCMGEAAVPVSIERVVEGIGLAPEVVDPFDIQNTTERIYRRLQEPGCKVMILRQPCATLRSKTARKRRVWVDQDRCRGLNCGCGQFCSRIWGCPGNIWDEEKQAARIDDVVCVGCGVCASICPAGAIMVEGEEE